LQTGAQLIEQGVAPRSGVRLLITGALGSVGRVAVHVARKHGAYVIAAVRSSQRAEAEKLGVSEVVAVDDESQLNSLKELDAVADTVGREVIDRVIPHIRGNGVLATVVGKPKSAEGRDLQVREVWSTSDPKRLQDLAGDLVRGEFTLPISKRLKLADIRQAHTLAEKGAAGKIVITP
jgi:NADPH:quinone reductase-like Zn-dependent oxidoreductase